MSIKYGRYMQVRAGGRLIGYFRVLKDTHRENVSIGHPLFGQYYKIVAGATGKEFDSIKMVKGYGAVNNERLRVFSTKEKAEKFLQKKIPTRLSERIKNCLMMVCMLNFSFENM
jgi:hypothetical protein